MAIRCTRHADRSGPAPSRAGLLAFWAVAAGVAGPAAAQTPRCSLEVGPTLARFEYVELTSAGSVIDREEGLVPGLVATAEVAPSSWFVRATGRLSSAEVRYEGRVQSTSSTLDGLPAASTTRAAFAGAEAQLGAWVDPRRRLAVFAGAGLRHWERDIQPTTIVSRTGGQMRVSGLYEEYSWGDVHGGIRWALLSTGSTALELDARGVRTLAPAMAVRWSGDTVRLRLQERSGWRLGLSARRVARGGWVAALGVHAERWSFGESASDPETGLREPESQTRSYVLEARLGHRF